jgi:hypothetical protein
LGFSFAKPMSDEKTDALNRIVFVHVSTLPASWNFFAVAYLLQEQHWKQKQKLLKTKKKMLDPLHDPK